MLQINNLTKYCDGVKLVDDFSLQLQKGEVFALAGDSKSGASQLLASVAGLASIDAGEIYINGFSLKESPIDYKRPISFVPESPKLYEFMTGIEFLNFISDMYQLDAETRNPEIERLTSVFGIDKELAMPVGNYTDASLKKLAIAAALLHRPGLLIMDRPFSGLDQSDADVLKELICGLRDNDCAVLISVENADSVRDFCDEIIFMDGGLISQNLRLTDPRPVDDYDDDSAESDDPDFDDDEAFCETGETADD